MLEHCLERGLETSRLDVWLGLLELEISINLLIQPSAEY